jgi:large subunit ribosomal protein L17
MRHRRATHRLGRSYSERQAMLENMVTSLLRHQQITTTIAKAKQAKRLADRVIQLGKKDSLTNRRNAFSYLQDHLMVSSLFKDIAPRFSKRQGGYTRIMHLGRRKGDGAQLVLLELTEKEIKIKTPPKSKKKEKGPAETPSAATTEMSAETKAEHAHPDDEAFKKHPEPKKDKTKKGFFRDLGKFFKNKGGS